MDTFFLGCCLKLGSCIFRVARASKTISADLNLLSICVNNNNEDSCMYATRTQECVLGTHRAS